MRTHTEKTAELGELVVAAFDEAARYSIDAREVARLATQAVLHTLRRTRMASVPPSRPTTPTEVDPIDDVGSSEIRLTDEVVRAHRQAQALALIVLGIDRIALIDERHGRQTEDSVPVVSVVGGAIP